MTTFHDFSCQTLEGDERDLSDFAGQVLLVVNVASECGLTPHYEGLEALHRELSGRGFSVVGFPCNQFGKQEPGDADTIRAFCTKNYGVSFPLMSKVEVNGDGRHPAWAFLCDAEAGPDGPGDVAWNFAKFVVGPNGEVVSRFAPTVKPDDQELRAAIVGALDAGS